MPKQFRTKRQEGNTVDLLKPIALCDDTVPCKNNAADYGGVGAIGR